jgi:hypothetical protein
MKSGKPGFLEYRVERGVSLGGYRELVFQDFASQGDDGIFFFAVVRG